MSAGMQALTEGSKDSSPYAWLWQNLEFADVVLEVVFTDAQVINTVADSTSTSDTQSADHEGQITGHHEQDVSVPAALESNLVEVKPVSTATPSASSKPVTSLRDMLQTIHDASAERRAIVKPRMTFSEFEKFLDTNDMDKVAASIFSNTRRYLLHSQVISSNSAFLRASLTTAVGAAKRKRGSEDDVCRWKIHVEMEREDAAAVEAVLQCFYKQKLDDTTHGSDLLSVMKVSVDQLGLTAHTN